MTFPIFTRNPLIVQEGILCVEPVRKAEFNTEVSPYTDYEDPLASLRNSKLGGIPTFINDVVVESRVFPTRVNSLESTKVIAPLLVRAPWHIWEAKLMDDVVVVIREANPKQPLHVFEYECLGLDVPNCPNGFGEHIALILMPKVFAAN
jgi:hypothetical protein